MTVVLIVLALTAINILVSDFSKVLNSICTIHMIIIFDKLWRSPPAISLYFVTRLPMTYLNVIHFRDKRTGFSTNLFECLASVSASSK